jgi:HK97 gp10 family phage protein
MYMELKVTGLRDVLDRLTGAAKKVSKGADNGAVSAATFVKVDAISRVPVHSGDLKSKIKVRKRKVGAQVVVDSDHASFVELGTSKTKARPFLRPAFYGNKSQIVSRLGKSVADEIK